MDKGIQEVGSNDDHSNINISDGFLKLGSRSVKKQKGLDWIIPLLRLVVLVAMVAATMLMALDKQTKTLVVATIGNTPIKATVVIKFHHVKAYAFLVVANAVGSLYTLLVFLVEIFGNKSNFKQLRGFIIPILDMIVVALVSVAAGGAAFVGEIAEHGNSHARWNQVCDNFRFFCDVGLAACSSSFIGILFLIILNAVVVISRQNRTLSSILP